jgi:hypothetical protein
VRIAIQTYISNHRRLLSALNPRSTMGSVISLRHLERIEGILRRRGNSNILTGGIRLVGKSALDGFDFSKGSFLAPTVIVDVNVEDELWQEEIFGPVVVVKRFSVSVFTATSMQTLSVVPGFHFIRASVMASHWQMHPSTALGQAYGPPIYPGHTAWRVKSSQALSGLTHITEMTQALHGAY